MRPTMLWCTVLLLLLCGGCSSVCKIDETRCNSNVAEVCDANGQWQRIMSCDEVVGGGGGEPWMCCLAGTDAGPIHACLPASMCAPAPAIDASMDAGVAPRIDAEVAPIMDAAIKGGDK